MTPPKRKTGFEFEVRSELFSMPVSATTVRSLRISIPVARDTCHIPCRFASLPFPLVGQSQSNIKVVYDSIGDRRAHLFRALSCCSFIPLVLLATQFAIDLQLKLPLSLRSRVVCDERVCSEG